MKALVYGGPGKRSWEVRPRPTLKEPTDAIVRITTTTICGTDLHILKGDVPEVPAGRILGHEGVGIVEEVGAAVSNVAVGDKVLLSCITSCGRCDFCKRSMYSHCRNGGWIFGRLIDGTQAEYVRVPFADTSTYKLAKDANDEAMVMLSDIFPTGYEVGVINGAVKPGDVVAIVGAGPIGLAVLVTAQLYSPAELWVIDLDPNRLEVARDFGATATFDAAKPDLAKTLIERSGGGVDVAVEAVGVPATFDLCQRILAPGGYLANVGVHGKAVQLELEKLWIRNVTIRTGLVDTYSTPQLLKMVNAGKLEPTRMVTHRFALADAMKAYDTFGAAAKEKAIKVILQAGT